MNKGEWVLKRRERQEIYFGVPCSNSHSATYTICDFGHILCLSFLLCKKERIVIPTYQEFSCRLREITQGKTAWLITRVLPRYSFRWQHQGSRCAQSNPQHYERQSFVFHLSINGLIHFLAKREEKVWQLARLMESFCRTLWLVVDEWNYYPSLLFRAAQSKLSAMVRVQHPRVWRNAILKQWSSSETVY